MDVLTRTDFRGLPSPSGMTVPPQLPMNYRRARQTVGESTVNNSTTLVRPSNTPAVPPLSRAKRSLAQSTNLTCLGSAAYISENQVRFWPTDDLFNSLSILLMYSMEYFNLERDYSRFFSPKKNCWSKPVLTFYWVNRFLWRILHSWACWYEFYLLIVNNYRMRFLSVYRIIKVEVSVISRSWIKS